MKTSKVKERKAGDLDEVKNYVSTNKESNLSISFGCLTSLQGCPEVITLNFVCIGNYLTSFEYFPKQINGNCHISHNNFTSFKDIDKHIEYIGYYLAAHGNDITSGFLDLFGIDGLSFAEIDNKEIQNILEQYLPTKDIINFQDEMIKSGYESYL